MQVGGTAGSVVACGRMWAVWHQIQGQGLPHNATSPRLGNDGGWTSLEDKLH
jgi:hypothetical protein